MNQCDRLRRILGLIHGQLTRATRNYAILHTLHKRRSDWHGGYGGFFLDQVQSCCLQDLALCFSRLLLEDPQSATIPYLLNYAKTWSECFPYAAKNDVLNAVCEHRKRIEDLSPLKVIVKDQRDKLIAHLDKRLLNPEPDGELFRAIPMEQLIDAFPILLQIYNTYVSFLDGSGSSLTLVEQQMETEVNYVLRLIASDARRPMWIKQGSETAESWDS